MNNINSPRPISVKTRWPKESDGDANGYILVYSEQTRTWVHAKWYATWTWTYNFWMKMPAQPKGV